MLYLGGLLGLLLLALWIYCLADVLTTDEYACRNLPKIGWLVMVLLLPLVGSIVWLVAGRPPREPRSRWEPWSAPGFPEYDRPGRFSVVDPDADAEFLRRCRERAEEQRRKARGENEPPGA